MQDDDIVSGGVERRATLYLPVPDEILRSRCYSISRIDFLEGHLFAVEAFLVKIN